MRTRANKNYVASDRAQRENAPRRILCYVQNAQCRIRVGRDFRGNVER